MIIIDNTTYRYPKAQKPTISNITLTISPGQIYGLLGANGTGKSTLLYLIAGMLKPNSGNITYKNVATIERRPSTLAEIFMVPEEIDLPAVDIESFKKRNSLFYPRFSEEQFSEYLREFRLDESMHLGRMSMGQKKKAMIAFALACNTSLLLLDEPTNGLDIPGKSEFRRALVSATGEGRTIIISTHQVRDLDHMLDAVIMLKEQSLMLHASMTDIMQRFRFFFTSDSTDLDGALWAQPVAGGYNVVRRREESEPETDVNLESLFELAYTNPDIFSDTK